MDGYNFATGGKDLGIRVYETKSNKVGKYSDPFRKFKFELGVEKPSFSEIWQWLQLKKNIRDKSQEENRTSQVKKWQDEWVWYSITYERVESVMKSDKKSLFFFQ